MPAAVENSGSERPLAPMRDLDKQAGPRVSSPKVLSERPLAPMRDLDLRGSLRKIALQQVRTAVGSHEGFGLGVGAGAVGTGVGQNGRWLP